MSLQFHVEFCPTGSKPVYVGNGIGPCTGCLHTGKLANGDPCELCKSTGSMQMPFFSERNALVSELLGQGHSHFKDLVPVDRESTDDKMIFSPEVALLHGEPDGMVYADLEVMAKSDVWSKAYETGGFVDAFGFLEWKTKEKPESFMRAIPLATYVQVSHDEMWKAIHQLRADGQMWPVTEATWDVDGSDECKDFVMAMNTAQAQRTDRPLRAVWWWD